MTHELPPFPGFQQEAFDFLTQLAAHNDRDWFKPRKSTFDDEIIWPMQCLLAEASREAANNNLNLTANPKKSIFRIYRDTRFSKNKDPYKTSVGAVLSKDGTHKTMGGVYIHLEPGKCFLAAGFWHPDNNVLRAWRARMADQPGPFMEVLHQLKDKGLDLESDESLKRIPRGFEAHKDTEIEPYLKWKSYTTSRAYKDKDLKSPSFAGEVVTFAQDVYPLLLYGWDVAG